jgi:ATP-dependent DNA helicase RecQ
LDYLIGEGYLRLEEGDYPVVDSAPRSREIITEKRPLTMMLPKEKPPARRPAEPELGERLDIGSLRFAVTRTIGKLGGSPGESAAAGSSTGAANGAAIGVAEEPVDEALLTKLKELRRSLAQASSVPAYIVFSDATLRDMCRKRPRTQAAFLAVSGVGEVKLKKYGEAFIRLIGEHGRGGA